MSLRIALVGLGKIAQDQHLPSIAASDRFTLAAAASPQGQVAGAPVFADLKSLLASDIAIDAVAMCQPPQYRFEAALAALRAGKHVLLEKPPGATSVEVDLLADVASAAGLTLYCAWHSRHAPGVEPARKWLAGRRLHSVSVNWQEDVREWHPGQQWIWEPGGMGVFDPGINALSIVTRLIGGSLRVCSGTLDFPANCQTPIAASLRCATQDEIVVDVQFDWLKPGPPAWDITVYTEDGDLRLSAGGAQLEIAGNVQSVGDSHEYRSIYAEFAALIDGGRSDADASPLRTVADAFLRCGRRTVAEFEY